MTPTIDPFTFINRTIWPLELANTLIASFIPCPLVMTTMNRGVSALPMILPLIPIAFIPRLISKGQYTVALRISIDPLTFIHGTVTIYNDSVLNRITILQKSFILGPIRELYKALGINEIARHLWRV